MAAMPEAVTVVVKWAVPVAAAEANWHGHVLPRWYACRVSAVAAVMLVAVTQRDPLVRAR